MAGTIEARRASARALAIAGASLMIVIGCGQEPPSDGIEVSGAVATEPIMGERAALYLSVTNHGPFDDVLEAITTPAAGRAELHRTVREESVRRMEPVRALPVPADTTISLAPGGYHIMLLDLQEGFVHGDTLTVTLLFRMRGDVIVRAPVVGHAEIDSALAKQRP